MNGKFNDEITYAEKENAGEISDGKKTKAVLPFVLSLVAFLLPIVLYCLLGPSLDSLPTGYPIGYSDYSDSQRALITLAGDLIFVCFPCSLLSIISAMLSVRAIKTKRLIGFPIAGLVIGVIGFFTSVYVMLFFIVVPV